MTWELLQGNCLGILPQLEPKQFHCCVTSPPYFGLRDYGCSDQLGLEDTIEEYISNMFQVFREVKRVLRDDGTLWLNMGDSYASDPRKGFCGIDPKNPGKGSPRARTNCLPPKQLIGIPWRVAFALQADGWYLRSDIIWSKPNPMPESVTDRPTKSHEYIFLLSKSPRYYYDAKAIREPMAPSSEQRGPVDFGGKKGRHYSPPPTDPNYRNGHEQWGRTYDYRISNADGNRNKRTVWTVSSQPFAEAHFATFPQKLIEPCILAGSPEGGWVLDPFAGSGTTLYTAGLLSRNAVGIELNEEYCHLIKRRMAGLHPSLFDFGGDTP